MAEKQAWKYVLLVLAAGAYGGGTAWATDALNWPQWLGAAVAAIVVLLVILAVPRLRTARRPDVLVIFVCVAGVNLFGSVAENWPPLLAGLLAGIGVACCLTVLGRWRKWQAEKQAARG